MIGMIVMCKNMNPALLGHRMGQFLRLGCRWSFYILMMPAAPVLLVLLGNYSASFLSKCNSSVANVAQVMDSCYDKTVARVIVKSCPARQRGNMSL